MFENVPARLSDAVRRTALRAGERHKHTIAANPSEFLDRKPGPDPGSISYEFTVKLMLIGETLFLLRSTPAFPEICRRLRSKDLRSMFSEAFAARFFFDAGFQIDARQERGVAGADFDFSASYREDHFNVEVTAIRITYFDRRKVVRRLYREIRQMREGQPAVIFCFHPETWLSARMDVDFHLMSLSLEFFNAVPRTNAIVFSCEKHIDLTRGSGALGGLLFPTSVYANPSPACPTSNINLLFQSKYLSLERHLRRKQRKSSHVSRNADDGSAVDDTIADTRENEFYQWVDYLLPRQGTHMTKAIE